MEPTTQNRIQIRNAALLMKKNSELRRGSERKLKLTTRTIKIKSKEESKR
jgi:hypothetical protein